MRIVKVARSKRCPYPPTGKFIAPPGVDFKFKAVEIQDNFINRRLRPEGARQSEAEANILSRLKAIANGYGSRDGDILGR